MVNLYIFSDFTSFGHQDSDIYFCHNPDLQPDLKQILYFIHNNQEVCGIMLHVVNYFKLNLDFFVFCWEPSGRRTCSVIKDTCTPVDESLLLLLF